MEKQQAIEIILEAMAKKTIDWDKAIEIKRIYICLKFSFTAKQLEEYHKIIDTITESKINKALEGFAQMPDKHSKDYRDISENQSPPSKRHSLWLIKKISTEAQYIKGFTNILSY